MAILYKANKDAIMPVGESLTEQEHLESCDINRQVERARRGLPLIGSANEPRYGVDDTNLDLMQVKNALRDAEARMNEVPKDSLSEEELAHVPEGVRKKFGLKAKPKSPAVKPSEAVGDKAQTPGVANGPNVDGPSGAVKGDGPPSSVPKATP